MTHTLDTFCPRCGCAGSDVSVTEVIDSLAVTPEGRLGPDELFLCSSVHWAACTDRACPVAWFSEEGTEVTWDQLRGDHPLAQAGYRIPPALPFRSAAE